MSKYQQLFNEITKNNKIMLICHKSPDGDAFGSTLALYKVLINLNKQVDVYCELPYNKKLSFIPNSDKFLIDKNEDKYDLAISLDCAASSRLGIYYDLFFKAKKTICIDHHNTNDGYANINFISPESAATCEYLYIILKEMEKEFPSIIDNEVATSLYCGIITDSGNFKNANTTLLTKKIAQEIEENYKVESSRIVKHFMDEIDFNVFQLKIRVLSKAIFNDSKTVGIICFKKEDFVATNTDLTCTEGIVNDIKDISGIRIAASIIELSDESYKISLRSDVKYPVNILAANKGGGGHPCAAGYQEKGYFYDVLDRVMRDCENYAE